MSTTGYVVTYLTIALALANSTWILWHEWKRKHTTPPNLLEKDNFGHDEVQLRADEGDNGNA